MQKNETIEIGFVHRPERIRDHLVTTLVIAQSACIVHPGLMVGSLDEDTGAMPNIDKRQTQGLIAPNDDLVVPIGERVDSHPKEKPCT